jgi:hypothetical protein
MAKKRTVSIFILVLLPLVAFPQRNDSLDVHLTHYSIAIGAGWTHYYNNLQYGDKNISKDFPGISFRFYWEPEYLLSLGLETGYYKLFKTKNQLTPDIAIESERTVTPFLLLVRMRIIKNFYLGAGFGLASITNKSSGPGMSLTTKTLSLSNYEASTSYIYPLSDKLRIGGDMKLYNFGNLNDWMYSLQATFAVRF